MAAKPKPITTAIIDRPNPCPPDFIGDALDALPEEINKVIIVDFGVDHPTPSMVEQIEGVLEHYSVCQPFSRITYLDSEGKRIGSMSSMAKGRALNDKRWSDPRRYCQRGIVGMVRIYHGPETYAMIPGEITSPVPTPYVAPVIEIPQFVESAPVYDIQDPAELYKDEIRILPEELANLDTPPKP